MQPNSTLPQNVQDLIDVLTQTQAVPLGVIDDVPFVALKVDNTALLQDDSVRIALKPSVVNVTLEKSTYALAIAVIQLLQDEAMYEYHAGFDLTLPKQYEDFFKLMQFKTLGVLLATQKEHTFMQFTLPNISLDMQAVTQNAKNKAQKTNPDMAMALINSLMDGAKEHESALKYFEHIAPLSKEWYVHFEMKKDDEHV